MYLTLRQMQYLEKIVLAGNMTLAASQLRVSPTALSLQIRLMEERSGHKLLERHSRGVRATPIGRELFRMSRQVLSLVEETEALLAAQPEERPRFRVGMSPSAMRSIGYDFLEARRTGKIAYDAELRELVLQQDLQQRLVRREIDVAVGFDLRPAPDLNITPVLEERLVLVAPPDFEADGPIRMADVLTTHLFMYAQEGGVWNLVRRVAAQEGLAVPEPEIIGSIDLILHLIADGRGTTIAPKSLVEKELARGAIREVDIASEPLHRTMCIAVKDDVLGRAAIIDLIDGLVDIARRRHDLRGSLHDAADVAEGAG